MEYIFVPWNKFSIKDFINKCDQIRSFLQISSRFTEEILNGKLHFLCSEYQLMSRRVSISQAYFVPTIHISVSISDVALKNT